MILSELYHKYVPQGQYPTGFASTDHELSVLCASRVYVIGARTAMGSTALALTFLYNQAVYFQIPVAYFSTLMRHDDIVDRLEVMYAPSATARKTPAGEKNKCIGSPFLSPNSSESPMYIRSPIANEDALYAEIRNLVGAGVKVIYIDNLQYLFFAEEQPILSDGRIIKLTISLRKLALELNIAIVLLSCLSSLCDRRGGSKRPALYDLKNAEKIADIADVVALLYRPEYYGITQDENGLPTDGCAELIIAKNRLGVCKSVNLKFIKDRVVFTDIPVK